MSEEQQSQPAAETQVTDATAEPEVPAWQKALDEAPAEELLKHNKFKGILGSELENRRKAWITEQEQTWQATRAAEERAKAEAELDDLANRDPDAFSARYLKDRLTQKQQNQLAEAGAEQTRLIGRLIGEAVRDIPEWAEMTDADQARFFEAVAQAEQKAQAEGRDPRQAAISAFNTTVVSRVAELRAARDHAKWRETDLAKEKAAMEEELKMSALTRSDRPDVGRVRGNGAISDEPDWKTDEAGWNRWFEDKQRARASANARA